MDNPVHDNRNIRRFLLAAAAIAWVLNVALVAALLTSPPVASTTGLKRNDPLSKVIDLADSALHCGPVASPIRYDGDFETPFRPVSEAFAPSMGKKNASSPVLHMSLILKGVLLKEQPLAILEDEKGTTFICGIGEKIQEYVVESIGPNHIRLRGPQGAVTLSVKE
jgi:hypothetical protein